MACHHSLSLRHKNMELTSEMWRVEFKTWHQSNWKNIWTLYPDGIDVALMVRSDMLQIRHFTICGQRKTQHRFHSCKNDLHTLTHFVCTVICCPVKCVFSFWRFWNNIRWLRRLLPPSAYTQVKSSLLITLAVKQSSLWVYCVYSVACSVNENTLHRL